MGFYKNTLNRDVYSDLYRTKIIEYCKEHNVQENDIIVQSFTIWMIINNYITLDQDIDINEENFHQIISRWQLYNMLQTQKTGLSYFTEYQISKVCTHLWYILLP